MTASERPERDDEEAPMGLRRAIANPDSVVGPPRKDETEAGWSARAVLASDWLRADREAAERRGAAGRDV